MNINTIRPIFYPQFEKSFYNNTIDVITSIMLLHAGKVDNLKQASDPFIEYIVFLFKS